MFLIIVKEKMESARLAQQKRRMIMFEKRSKKKQYEREKTLHCTAQFVTLQTKH